jgi:hypothetical protein
MKRHILLCGANYKGQSCALRGCLNDVEAIYKWLVRVVKDWDTLLILREEEMNKAQWLDALTQFADRHESGDEGLHAHSHHGSYEADPSESDGRRELWVPPDYRKAGMISDDDVSAIYDRVHPEAHITDWADCCHASGSTRDLFFGEERARFLPPPDMMQGDIPLFYGHRVTRTPVDVEKRPNISQLAACFSSQTSADAYIDGQWCGAFTHYALEAQGDVLLPRAEIVDKSATLLARNGYGQHPEFCGTSANALRPIFTLGKAA